MSANERLRSRGAARARRILADFAVELRTARLHAGLSQDELGERAGLSGDKVWRAEHERLPTLSIVDACQMAAVVGLDLSARLFESGASVRDASQTPRLMRLLSHVATPLLYRTEVRLPRLGDRVELRAWDAVLYGESERTGVELESRLTDIQAMNRRHNGKRTDDPVEHFLLVVAATKHNRRVLTGIGGALGDLSRVPTSTVLEALEAGQHPPTGWTLF